MARGPDQKDIKNEKGKEEEKIKMRACFPIIS